MITTNLDSPPGAPRANRTRRVTDYDTNNFPAQPQPRSLAFDDF